MSTSSSGSAASTAAEILARQDDEKALRLLLGQRVMYRKAKAWSMLRTIGFGALALGAPIVVVLAPSTAGVVGALVGVWIFASRSWFLNRENAWIRSAAAAQDEFDRYVFGLDRNAAVVEWNSPEAIRSVTPDDVLKEAEQEQLVGWYLAEPTWPRLQAIAVLQRANAAYAGRLLATGARAWLIALITWGAIASLVAAMSAMTLVEILIGVALPVLPAVLDAYEQRRAMIAAAEERERLAKVIEEQFRGESTIEVAELKAWQDQLFRLRVETPLVSERIYRLARPRNERLMANGSRDLIDLASDTEGTPT